MDQHHQQQQHNRRRAVDAGGGSGQAHPPPQPCPRCNSNNTKFCYYNNYSLSQPRFFCKGCRRYWTQGGTLRNVPVGGGCRKSKRPKLEGSSGASSHPQAQAQAQAQAQLPLALPVPRPSQLPHQHLISIMANNNNNSSNNNNNNMSSNNNNISSNNNNIGYFGETSGLFLSSLGVNRPMNFGPNLGLLHGFGLPNFDHQQQVQQQQHNQEVSLPSLYSTRELGSSSIQEWNLRMGPGPGPGLGPGPVVAQGNINVNANDNDHNNNRNNNRDQERNDNIRGCNETWSNNFLGTSGLDDP